MMKRQGSIDTQLIHAGEIRPGIEGAVALPIFQCANFESVEGETYHDIKYMRLSNSPNHVVLGEKLAALEGAEAGLVLTTGMAAITTIFHSLLSAGDHVIFQDCLYGGTYDYARREFARHGLTCDFVDGERSRTCPRTGSPGRSRGRPQRAANGRSS